MAVDEPARKVGWWGIRCRGAAGLAGPGLSHYDIGLPGKFSLDRDLGCS